MKKEIILDELHDANKVLEKFFSFFEVTKLNNSSKEKISDFEKSLISTERLIQDISEKITVNNEFNNDNKYRLIINLSVDYLNKNYVVLISKNIKFDMIPFVLNNISELNDFLKLSRNDNTSKDEIEEYFDYINEKLAKYLSKGFETNTLNFIISEDFIYQKTYEIMNPEVKRSPSNLTDGENILYIGELDLWIDTKNPAEANKFMFLVSDIISKIQNVELILEDAKVGSYFQKIKIKIKGWFAKEEFKQIVAKSSEALESYTIDRHIEPIKKSQSERRKNDEEIDRMMPKEMVTDLQKIQVEMAREELESKKLENFQKKLEINKTLSEILQNGLLTIDSDFRISLNNVVLIEQKDKVITTCDNIEKIDLGFRKKIIEESSLDTRKEEINPTAEE